MIANLEKKQDEERVSIQAKMMSELKEEKTKSEATKYQLSQSLKNDYKHKYEFEEMKADAHFQELKVRK